MLDEDIKLKIIPCSYEIVRNLEKVRLDAFDKPNENVEMLTKEFFAENTSGIMALYKDEIVAGCYVSSHAPVLYISYLFVHPDYQKKQYYIGKKILLETLKRKIDFENYYCEKFSSAHMIAENKKLKELYLSWGFEAPYQTLLVRKNI